MQQMLEFESNTSSNSIALTSLDLVYAQQALVLFFLACVRFSIKECAYFVAGALFVCIFAVILAIPSLFPDSFLKSEQIIVFLRLFMFILYLYQSH